MDKLIKSYVLGFDEINAMISTSYYSSISDDMKKRTEQVCDDLLSLLIETYQKGIGAVVEMLQYGLLEPNADEMFNAIYRKFNGKDFEDRTILYLIAEDLDGLQKLAENEYHRVFNTALHDGAMQYSDKTKTQLNKTWRTMLDERVRDTHSYLEGVSVKMSDKFYTYDGDSANYPGDFENAENNVNCRCFLLFSKSKAN